MSTLERQRLDKAMDDRRARLGLSWEDVSNQAGLSVATLRRARRGAGELTIDTMIGIERALWWAPGSVEAILRGDVPEELTPARPDTRHVSNEQIDDAERRILSATNAELVDMFRVVESAPGMTRTIAGQWLVDALDMRDRARQRREATKRDAS